jgi:hypothetical protein
VRLLKVRPPYPVTVFAVLAAAVVLAALVHEGPRGRWVGAGLLLLIATFGLVQGVWAAWLFLVVVAVADIVVGVLEWPDWPAAQIIALNGFMLALLLAPSTRRYVRRGRPRLLAKVGFGRLT